MYRNRQWGTLNLVLADFTDALVTREWRGIDVLIESKINRLVWAIENKIDSTESEDQLTSAASHAVASLN